MTTIPPTRPPLERKNPFVRNLAPGMAFVWLREGWADFRRHVMFSLFYGLGVYCMSLVVVWGAVSQGLSAFIFPLAAGFMILGPMLATGLYEKSLRIMRGEKVTLGSMIFARSAAGAQILFVGVLLMLLMLLWMRAAVILYALFFGTYAFPGLAHLAPLLLTTPTGWALLVIGSLVGGLFAAFAFAVSVFAIPMLMDEPVDALTAMGTSLALVWNNLPVMCVWGMLATGLYVISLLPGMLGLIFAFPLLGHSTWRAWEAMREDTIR
jgi:uncharacterized membrane protein